MYHQDELSEILPHYLRERHQLSEDAIQTLCMEWKQQGCMLDFLVGKSLLTRPTARTLDAVRKGYFNRSFADVLGMKAKLTARARPAEAHADNARWQAAQSPTWLPPPLPGLQLVAEPEPQLPARPAPGMTMGRFTLQEQIGSGATGTVFRSFHPMLDIPVAIKVFAPLDPFDLAVQRADSQRFVREAQTLARLQHPNIVRVLEVDICEQFPYIVMEYVGEQTLESQIQNQSRLPAQRIAQVGIAVADALDFTWQHGVLHRDVKPANILERRDGRIKLADFGISAERSSTGGLSDPEAVRGYVSGTPSFVAPEQALTPNDIDFRADMYGLGATLYNAAVGVPPFAAATAYDTIMAQIHDEPTPILQIDPGFDPRLAAAIHRMLEREREARFRSWAEVRAALN